MQPRRWVINRSFDWIACCCVLSRNQEATPTSALAFFLIATPMIPVGRMAQAL